MLVLATGLAWIWARPNTSDDFYSVPAQLPQKPGQLLRQEIFEKPMPVNARAWRILYSTSQEDGAGFASAVIVAPVENQPDPSDVVAYAHGTIGVVPGCVSALVAEEFPNGSAKALLEQSLAHGWIFVAPDYVGLGSPGPHPFLIGRGEARSVLDAIRAAFQIKELKLSGKTVIWGHSQGGHAALWSGQFAPGYAPEINILGVAAISPASDLVRLIGAAQGSVVGKILSAFIAAAYTQNYPELRFDEVVRPEARLLARDMASRCLSGKKTLFSVLEAKLLGSVVFSETALNGSLAARLADNTPRGNIPSPLLIAQGESDELVLPSIQEEFVKERCHAGQNMEFWKYADRGHLDILENNSNLPTDLAQWTQDRLAGKYFAPGCRESLKHPEN
jgi:pimeloyl-ACP methyl ester carboxylesterase